MASLDEDWWDDAWFGQSPPHPGDVDDHGPAESIKADLEDDEPWGFDWDLHD